MTNKEISNRDIKMTIVWGGIVIIMFIGGLNLGQNSPKVHAAELKKNSVGKMCPLPVTPKPDSCRKYQEKALTNLQEMERFERERNWPISNPASVSAAYSGYYLVCRDLERRESR